MVKKQMIIRAVVIFLVAFIMICCTLYSKETVVLTNNGDFNRVTRLCSLTWDSQGDLRITLGEGGFFKNIHKLLFTPEDISGYPSSQLLFVRSSVALSYFWNAITHTPLDVYHPGILSVFFSLLYAFVLMFTLLQVESKNRYFYWLFVGISLIMLCDIGYVSYFNSLYAEGLQHIFLVAILGFFLKLWKRPLGIIETVLFSVCLLLFGQSKFFNIPLTVIMVLLAVGLTLRHSFEKRPVIVNAVASVLVVATLFNTYSVLPKWISKETNYNSVFYGILKDCDDATAKAYLEELELDTRLYSLKNTHHYVSNFSLLSETYPVTQAEDISKWKLLSFYVRHPFVTLQKCMDIIEHSAHIRNIFFMDESYMDDATRCSLWSKIREHIGFDTVWLNLFVMVLLLGLLGYRFCQTKTKPYLTVILLLLIFFGYLYAFLVPYVSNGEADLSKHMFLFVELMDLSLLGILAMGVSLSKKWKGMIAGVLCLSILFNLISFKTMETVSFGGYQWYVIEEDDTQKTLIAKDIIGNRSYHSQLDNHYKNSDIHQWLNGDFLNGFSVDEKEQLIKMEEEILLSSAYVSASEEGNRDFYCSAFPKRVANGADEAYRQRVLGTVFLPTVEHISKMANNGYRVTLGEKYWLSTPYFNNGKKSRYVHPDGLIYFENTDESMGIRPVIYLRK